MVRKATMQESVHNRGEDGELMPPSTDVPRRERTSCTATSFYGEYHGHTTSDLEVAHAALRPRDLVWLLGDSSLDNKFWLLQGGREAACNGYESFLKPPRAVPDVAHWVNAELVRRGVGGRLACLNTSVEESTLADRPSDTLLPQDLFCRDHVLAGDTLVVSVGCNDVALRPSPATGVSMLMLTRAPTAMIRSGWAPGTNHFRNLFREQTMAFVRRVLARPKRPEEAMLANGGKPRRVVVCTIYFLDQRPNGSWADRVLGLLGYDSNPEKLKEAIRAIHHLGHATIADVDGVEVVALPFFEHLDGTDPHGQSGRLGGARSGQRGLVRVHLKARGCSAYSGGEAWRLGPAQEAMALQPHAAHVAIVAAPVHSGTDPDDYVQRVEPSAQGGRKMAAAIADAVLAERPEGGWPAERLPNAYRGDGSGAGGCAIL